MRKLRLRHSMHRPPCSLLDHTTDLLSTTLDARCNRKTQCTTWAQQMRPPDPTHPRPRPGPDSMGRLRPLCTQFSYQCHPPTTYINLARYHREPPPVSTRQVSYRHHSLISGHRNSTLEVGSRIRPQEDNVEIADKHLHTMHTECES